MPMHVEFSPYGNFAILTLGVSNRIEVRDVNRPTQVFSAIAGAGTFPRARSSVPEKRLFVQGALSRDVLVYDMSALLDDFDGSTPPLRGHHPRRREREAGAADPRRQEDLSRRVRHPHG